MVYLIEQILFSIFPSFYFCFLLYHIMYPIHIDTNYEYYSLMNSVFFYIIFLTMDIILCPFIYHRNIFFFLIFLSVLFEMLSLIQYLYFENILNVYLSSYCIFGFFKFSYLYIKEKNSEQETVISFSVL